MYSDDPHDLYREILRTARKTHDCIDCKRKILPRDKYWDIRILYDGEWDNIKECQRCRRVRIALWREDRDEVDGWAFSSMVAFGFLKGALAERSFNRHRWHLVKWQ